MHMADSFCSERDRLDGLSRLPDETEIQDVVAYCAPYGSRVWQVGRFTVAWRPGISRSYTISPPATQQARKNNDGTLLGERRGRGGEAAECREQPPHAGGFGGLEGLPPR